MLIADRNCDPKLKRSSVCLPPCWPYLLGACSQPPVLPSRRSHPRICAGPNHEPVLHVAVHPRSFLLPVCPRLPAEHVQTTVHGCIASPSSDLKSIKCDSMAVESVIAVFQLLPTSSNFFQLPPTSSNFFQLLPTSSDLFHHPALTRPGLHPPVRSR